MTSDDRTTYALVGFGVAAVAMYFIAKPAPRKQRARARALSGARRPRRRSRRR
jgi:phosphotransferase system  glucose/maltose/N-acetylglucosamine-specific IIC component